MSLSTTYKTRAGDTWSTIARSTTGRDTEAARISYMNPGVLEPIQAGTSVLVPDIWEGIADVDADDPDEISIKIEGKVFKFWESARILSAADAITRIEFTTPFEYKNAAFRELFRPLSFRRITVALGGVVFFAGRMGTVRTGVSATRAVATVPCFAEAGLLETVNPPASAFPLEFKNLNLQQIAARLAVPFGVSVQFDEDPGAIFEKVACSPTVKILPFLVTLAKQRGLIVRDGMPNKLVFTKSVAPGRPIGTLPQGESPLLGVAPAFKEGLYCGEMTGIKPARPGSKGGARFTVRNPRLSGVLRPSNFIISDSEGGNTRLATEGRMGRMFGAVVDYTARIATHRDPRGYLWQADQTINVYAPEAMIYSPYEFLIRVSDVRLMPRSRTATLRLALPEAFRGGVPEAMPWDE